MRALDKILCTDIQICILAIMHQKLPRDPT